MTKTAVRAHFSVLVLLCVLGSGCGTRAPASPRAPVPSHGRGADQAAIPLDSGQPQPTGIVGSWVSEPVDPSRFVMLYYWLDDGRVETETLWAYPDMPAEIEAGRYKLVGEDLEFRIDQTWDGSQWHPASNPTTYWTIRVRGDTMTSYEYGSGGSGTDRRISRSEIATLRSEVEKHRKANVARTGR